MILNVSELLAVVRKDIYIVRRAWHSRILYLPFIKKECKTAKAKCIYRIFYVLKKVHHE